MRSKLLALTALSLLIASCALAQEVAPSVGSLSAQVDALFQKMDTTITPGCALSVVKDGRIIYERGYGMADLDHNVFRHLLHHTSGLRDQWDLLSLAGWRYSLDLITDEDVLAVISRQRDLNFPPGTRYLYSNTGFTLLAQIVKRVSGQSLREYTTSHMFQPLQMNNTHFRDDHAEIVRNIAYGYEPAKDTFRISITNFDTVGATSLLTTVEDLAHWDENFYVPRVGGPAMIQQLQERGKLNDGEQLDYASGLVIGTYRGLATVDHAGADAGYRSDMIRFPDQHFTAACLCNSAAANPSQLTRKVAEIYLDKEMKPAEPARGANETAVQLTPGQLSSKAGAYVNAEDGDVLRISVKNDKLQAGWGTGEESYKLKAVSENHFYLLTTALDLTFEPLQPGGSRQLFLNDGKGKPRVFAAVAPFTPSPGELKDYAGIYSSHEIEPLYDLKLEPNGLVLHRLRNEPDALQPVARDLFVGSIGNIRFIRNSHGDVSGFLLNDGRIQNFRFEKGRPAIPSK